MSVNGTCTSRHIPTFHGGQSCPNPVAEAHPVNEKTPKADAAVVVRGIGIIPVRIPINQVAAQKDRSRFSTMRHPWFLNIFEPCQRWQLTEFRCLYSACWCVWALQLRATNATRTKSDQKVNSQGEIKHNHTFVTWVFYNQQLFKRILKESKQPIGPLIAAEAMEDGKASGAAQRRFEDGKSRR